MKRLMLLLPAAFLLLLVTTPAHAASETCRLIREDMSYVPPVSPYTAKVLARANNGISFARSSPTNADFARYLPGWAQSVESAWAGLIDSQIQYDFESQELPQMTACLHFDLLLLDCKMEEVGEVMKEELSRGSFASILRLESLLSFLNERRRHLQLGAHDPQYSDPTWGQRYLFDGDQPAWCCSASADNNVCTRQSMEECEEAEGTGFFELDSCTANGCKAPEDSNPAASVLCPYHSDYAPAFQSGYGCDLQVMALRSAYPPMNAEREGLQLITDQIDRYREIAEESLLIQQEIDELYGLPTTGPQTPKERVHLTAYGCGWSGGYCTENPQKRCITNSECAGEGSCEMPVKVCSENRITKCFSDEQCPGSGTCIDAEELPAAHALRGPFSLDKDNVAILSEFLGLRSQQEISREYQDDLKTSNEFLQSESSEGQQRADEERNPLLRYFRTSVRLTVRTWNRIQGRKEAVTFPQAVDAQLEIARSLTSLRSAISELSKLSSEKDGVRSFVSAYAYFIGRTCIYRPCSMMLERVVRIVTADECFPYTNGEYLSDTENDPRWEKCRRGMTE